jgi:hypothetical protein
MAVQMELNEPLEVGKVKRSNTLGREQLRHLKICEVIVLPPVILVIIGLFSIPTALYAAASTGAEVRKIV